MNSTDTCFFSFFIIIDSNKQVPALDVNKTTPTVNLVEEIDVYQYLVLRKEGEDGPDVKGGPLDALIVHATKVQKVCDSGKRYCVTHHIHVLHYHQCHSICHRNIIHLSSVISMGCNSSTVELICFKLTNS